MSAEVLGAFGPVVSAEVLGAFGPVVSAEVLPAVRAEPS